MNETHLETSIVEVADLINRGSVVALTGAGISHSAGIPTYRNEQGQWLGSDPMTHQAFMREPLARQRYWARSARGYPLMHRATPTVSHQILAELQRLGRLSACITQNVDALHERAGHQDVLHLHGRIEEVICLDCGALSPRSEIQKQIEALNPDLPKFHDSVSQVRPDGDIDLDGHLQRNFKVPSCPVCDGLLKPNVVFFGGHLQSNVKATATQAIESSSALLAIGSSLQVFSGFRLCRLAADLGLPVILLNPGKSRADPLATHRINERSDAALPLILREIQHGA